MRAVATRAAAGGALLLALACGRDEPRLRVTTTGLVFDRGGTGIVAQATVPYVVSNRGERTAFLTACGGRPIVSVERGTGTSWEDYDGWGCITTLQPALELRAGESVVDSFPFVAAGRFRIRVDYGVSGAERSETAVSNTFEVR